jgi:hypothetical protein
MEDGSPNHHPPTGRAVPTRDIDHGLCAKLKEPSWGDSFLNVLALLLSAVMIQRGVEDLDGNRAI